MYVCMYVCVCVWVCVLGLHDYDKNHNCQLFP